VRAVLQVLIAEPRPRGWTVNLNKTVVGCGYHVPQAGRAAHEEHVASVFADLLPRAHVQSEGQVILGVPYGPDLPDCVVPDPTCWPRSLVCFC
jgi:hypothetical protein